VNPCGSDSFAFESLLEKSHRQSIQVIKMVMSVQNEVIGEGLKEDRGLLGGV
jgi:hypothetical protein